MYTTFTYKPVIFQMTIKLKALKMKIQGFKGSYITHMWLASPYFKKIKILQINKNKEENWKQSS